MPLTRADLAGTEPAVVLLGHIHTPYDGPPVYYPGSPCPLDVNETGPRRFLVFNTETMEISDQRVDSPRVYFNETVVMLPVADEAAFLRDQLRDRIRDWGLPEGWEDRVQVRLRVVGYTIDRAAVEEVAKEAISDFAFYGEGPDISALDHTQDADRIEIARQVQEWIEGLEWSRDPAQPTKDEILREALAVIYAA
jgi:DNA repair exonuclease SbcCD nuclease subunit